MNFLYVGGGIELTGKVTKSDIFSFYDFLKELKAAHVIGTPFTKYGSHTFNPILVRQTTSAIETTIHNHGLERPVRGSKDDTSTIDFLLSEEFFQPRERYDVCANLQCWNVFELFFDEMEQGAGSPD